MRQVLLVVSIFAIVSAVWMYRLHQAGRAEVMFRAATQAGLEARERNLALVAAVRASDSQTVGQLLAAGGNPDWPEAEPRPLEIAVRHGDIESIKLLLAAGASPRGHGHIPLIATAIDSPIDPSSKLLILQQLLEHGANIENDPLASDAGFGSGSAEIIALFRQQGAGYGPREMALAGDLAGLQAAFASDPDLLARPLETYCNGSKTLLGVALRHGHVELANWMLDRGAPLEVHEISGGSALHVAAVGNCAGVILRLCQLGCDPNGGDDSGETPLDYCISIASPATIQALIDCGANVKRTEPRVGNTALHRAILRYDCENDANPDNGEALEIVAILLDAGADINAVDANGLTVRDSGLTRSAAIRALFERR